MKLFNREKRNQSKEVESRSKKPVRSTDDKTDALFRRLRLFEQRLSAIESIVSALRRDVNRIDRKQYRDVERQPVEVKPQPVDQFFDLFKNFH